MIWTSLLIFFFQARDTTSKTIHVNKKEDLKFYSFSKELEELPETNRDDNLSQAMEKIKNILEMNAEQDKVSYSKLVDLLFSPSSNSFLQKENKVDYLLTFLDIKHKNLCDIEHEYKNYKKSLDKLSKKLITIMGISKNKINEKKYNKFINKYNIKINSKEIFEYLDNMIEYIMPTKIVEENEKEKKSDSDSDNDGKGDEGNDDYKKKENYPFNFYEKFEKKEENLRNNILELFEKDQKFISYFPNYYWTKLNNYFNEIKENFMKNIESMLGKIKMKFLLYLKLQKLKDIIDKLKIYHFDIQQYFKTFADNYDCENHPIKKKKISAIEAEKQDITNMNYFIKRLKEYIGDVNENVEITKGEPGEFVFKLFLEKIGFNLQ